MSTTTSADVTTDQFTKIMESFDEEVPCGSLDHDNPRQAAFHDDGGADALIVVTCSRCAGSESIPGCKTWADTLAMSWERLTAISHCVLCGHVGPPSDWGLRVRPL